MLDQRHAWQRRPEPATMQALQQIAWLPAAACLTGHRAWLPIIACWERASNQSLGADKVQETPCWTAFPPRAGSRQVRVHLSAVVSINGSIHHLGSFHSIHILSMGAWRTCERSRMESSPFAQPKASRRALGASARAVISAEPAAAVEPCRPSNA